ncbi:MAG TPA: hypothetical protein VFU81_23165 [Thermomicrobiales bacterium]|nr:hypothetical protein [Thermomicrobiales bacterium]
MADREIQIESGTVGAGGFPGDTSSTGGLRAPSAAGAGDVDVEDEGGTDDETDGTGTIRGGVAGGGSGAGGGPGTINGVRNGAGDRDANA